MVPRILLVLILTATVGSFANAGLIASSDAFGISEECQLSDATMTDLLRDLFAKTERQQNEVKQNTTDDLMGTSKSISGSLAVHAVSSARVSPFETPDETGILTVVDHTLPPSPDLDGILKPPQGFNS